MIVFSIPDPSRTFSGLDEGKLFEHNIVHGNEGGGVAAEYPIGSGRAELSWNLIFKNPGGDCLSTHNFTFDLLENAFEDPLLYVDDESTDGSVAMSSPALAHPAGPIGAIGEPGCGPSGARVPWNFHSRFRSNGTRPDPR